MRKAGARGFSGLARDVDPWQRDGDKKSLKRMGGIGLGQQQALRGSVFHPHSLALPCLSCPLLRLRNSAQYFVVKAVDRLCLNSFFAHPI